MKNLKTLAVFCGASKGFKSTYVKAAKEAGKYLSNKGINLVFGGGKIGLMGAIANAVLDSGGTVIGVIPEFLRHEEVEHDQVTKMIITNNMSDRKITISKMVDGYIALPGGFGTLDEIFEALTLGQLGVETKPVGLLNVSGFFDPLLLQLDKMVEEGFLKKENREMILVASKMEELCEKMEKYIAPQVSKLINTVGS